MKRQVWFISEAGKARCLRLGIVGAASGIHIQRQAFISGGRGPHAEAAQTALTVILKWVVSGLICVILIVLYCFSLSSVPESVCSHFFEEILEVVAVYVMATVESSCTSSAW